MTRFFNPANNPGQPWEQTCLNTPADFNGVHFDRPARCVTNTAEWGQFDVPDSTCPHWGTFKADACSLPGKRQYSAILEEIPNGMVWADVCASTSAVVNGQSFARPSRCSNQGTAMWGEFDVVDTGCSNPTTTSHSVTSHCPAGQTCVYPRPRYLNLYWSAPGEWDASAAASGSGMTRASIDRFTRLLTRSGYFSALAQYGVGTPSFIGSREASASCLQQFPVPNTAGFVHISGFVACQVNALRPPSTQNVIVNLFLPPTVTPEWVNATIHPS